MKPVAMKTSSVDEFAAVLDGSYFGNKFDMMQAYGYVKYVATMWMLSMARKYPDLKFVAMSPGNTGGTNAPDKYSPTNEVYDEVFYDAYCNSIDGGGA